MKYKILVLDLDGTLTNKKKEITERTRDTLIRAQQAGVHRIGFRQTNLWHHAFG